MKILHLVSYSLWSGPVPSVLGLALAQTKLGHSVHVALDRVRGSWNGFEEPVGPRYEALSELHPPFSLSLSRRSGPWTLARDGFVLSKETPRYDVVHAHMSHDHSVTALTSRAPLLVRTLHTMARPSRANRWVWGRTGGIVCRSVADAEAISRFGLNAPTAVVPASLSDEGFGAPTHDERDAARDALGIPTNAKVVGIVAFVAGRGQRPLIEALTQLADDAWHLVVVGDGEERPALERLVTELGLSARVHFTGYVQGADLVRVYHAFDVSACLVPGKDGGFRSTLEALGSGVPVLGADLPVVRELPDMLPVEIVPDVSGTSIARQLSGFNPDPDASRRAAEWVKAHRSFRAEAQTTVELYHEWTQ